MVCYTREVLGQTGAGHFSPIGGRDLCGNELFFDPMPIVRGYDEETDSILIMDVARFKYPPHWVPLTDLTDAMLKARNY